MTYLLQYARLPLTIAPRPRPMRVDEAVALNRPGYYGEAFVRVAVEDTTSRGRGRREPLLALQVADCVNTVNLEFRLDSAGERDNALFKIDTLLVSLSRFRDGLAAEAELAAAREARRR